MFPSLFYYIGIFLVSGLILGSIASQVSILKGYRGHFWFVMGFIANVFSIIGASFNPDTSSNLRFRLLDQDQIREQYPTRLVRFLHRLRIYWSRMVYEMKLTKSPTTYIELRCTLCETPNHPGATCCSSCKTAFKPMLESEAHRIQPT